MTLDEAIVLLKFNNKHIADLKNDDLQQVAEWLEELKMYKSLAPRELVSEKQKNDRTIEYSKGFEYGFKTGYKKAIDVLKMARRIEDLFPFKGLNFEALQGDKIGLCSVRANGQYRVEFKVSTVGDEQIITICLILELSNHYK